MDIRTPPRWKQRQKPAYVIWPREVLKRWITRYRSFLSRDLIALLLSTALFEVSGNIVYVMLMEQAFHLGGGATSVGIFLVLQAGGQLAMGPIIGSLADNLGARNASILGLMLQAGLALGLVFTSSILWLYFITFLLTLARLFVITSRLPLLSHLSKRTSFLRTNVTVYTLTGLGLFLGPASGAALYLIWNNPVLPFLAASAAFILAMLPLVLLRTSSSTKKMNSPPLMVEVRIGWRHIVRNRSVWEVLMCLSISSAIFGALMPTLTLLAKRMDLGSEGTGVLVAAIGLGWLLGPLTTNSLIQKLSYTKALLLTGLVTPLAILAIGFTSSIPEILIGLALAAFAGAGLNVIVMSIIQRLTPKHIQGSVVGTQQALSGLVWIASATSTTILLGLPQFQVNPRALYFPLGALGALSTIACWAFGQGTLRRLLRE
jgi:MFS family permease